MMLKQTLILCPYQIARLTYIQGFSWTKRDIGWATKHVSIFSPGNWLWIKRPKFISVNAD